MKNQELLIHDGGMSRQLIQHGAPFRQPEWSALALMECPESVTPAHSDFINAGADVITTNSYAVVPYHIGQDVFDERGSELLKLAGQSAQQAAQLSSRKIRVAAGIPPMFGSYRPNDFDPKRAVGMLTIFRENLLPYSDLILAETFSSVVEISTFLDVFGDCGKPIWVTISITSAPAPRRPAKHGSEVSFW